MPKHWICLWEIRYSLSWTILTQGGNRRLCGTRIFVQYNIEERMCKFLVFLDLQSFSTILCSPKHWLCVWKWDLHYLGQYSPRTLQKLYGTRMFILYNLIFCSFVIFLELEPFSIFLSAKTRIYLREMGISLSWPISTL